MTPILEVSRFPVSRRRRDFPRCSPNLSLLGLPGFGDEPYISPARYPIFTTATGRIYSFGQGGADNFKYSDDGGTTWISGDGPISEVNEPNTTYSLAVTSYGTKLYAIYLYDTAEEGPLGISFSTSVRIRQTDASGLIWGPFTEIRLIEDHDAGGVLFCDIAADAVGNIYYIWEEASHVDAFDKSLILRYKINNDPLGSVIDYGVVSAQLLYNSIQYVSLRFDSNNIAWAFWVHYSNTASDKLVSSKVVGGTEQEIVPESAGVNAPRRYSILSGENGSLHAVWETFFVDPISDGTEIKYRQYSGGTWGTTQSLDMPSSLNRFHTPCLIDFSSPTIVYVGRSNPIFGGDGSSGIWVAPVSTLTDFSTHQQKIDESELQAADPSLPFGSDILTHNCEGTRNASNRGYSGILEAAPSPTSGFYYRICK